MQGKTLKLNNGQLIPAIGFGTWLLKKGKDFIKKAVLTGQRHIDTAKAYDNESDIGNAIAELEQEKLIKREELFITTKLWNSAKKEGSVENEVKTSLSKLKMNQLDLQLIHWPFGELDPNGISIQPPLQKTWLEMEKCVEKGLVRGIGVCNFNVQLLLDLCSYAKIKPAVNQIENHPYLIQESLVKFCQKSSILVEAYAPLGAKGQIQYRNFNYNLDLLEDPIIKKIAGKYKKSTAQVLINWQIARGNVPLAKTETETRLKENLDSQNFEMEEEDVKTILDLDRGFRIYNPSKLGWPPVFS